MYKFCRYRKKPASALLWQAFTLVATGTFMTGCTHRPLDLHTEFIGREQLASYHVGTPDLRLANPDVGQQLIIHWSLPPSLYHYPALHINVTIRFRNGQERHYDYPLKQRYGMQIVTVINEEFQKMGDIATYKAQLCSGALVLTKWHHCLWNETITILEQ